MSALVRLRANDDGSIAITVASPYENERYSVDNASLVVTMWAEDPNVIRGRVEHPCSHAVAYFQSAHPSLRAFAESIHLVVPRPA